MNYIYKEKKGEDIGKDGYVDYIHVSSIYCIKLTYSMHLFNANAFYSEVIMMVVKFFVLLGVERFVKKKKSKSNPRCTLVLFLNIEMKVFQT